MDRLLQNDESVSGHRPLTLRWAILFQFATATLANAMFSLTFSPISSIATKYYNVGFAEINALSASYMILYPFGTVLAFYARFRLGTRGAMLVCMFVMIVSGWMRYLSSESSNSSKAGFMGYPLLLIGQGLAGLMQPFVMNNSSAMAAKWFPSHERTLATTLAAMSNVVGLGVGTVLPSALVSGSGGIPTLLLVQAIVVSVVGFVILLFFQGEPSVPPSLSQLRRSSEPLLRSPELVDQQIALADLEGARVWDEVKTCLQDRQFRRLLLGFSMQVGLFSALSTLIEQMVQPAGYSSQDAGMFGGTMMICGILSAGVVGAIVDRNKRYKLSLRLLNLLSVCSFVFFTLVLRPDNYTWLTVSFALMGSVMLPALPVSLECASECMFPVSEDASTGLLIMFGQPFGIILTFGLGHLVSLQKEYKPGDNYVFEPTYAVALAYSILSVISIFLFDGKSRREGFERVEDSEER